jgi:hypothetical protein
LTDSEPQPADHKILSLPNVIVTCHTAREVARVLTGQPPTTEVKDPWLLAEKDLAECNAHTLEYIVKL